MEMRLSVSTINVFDSIDSLKSMIEFWEESVGKDDGYNDKQSNRRDENLQSVCKTGSLQR